MRAFNRAGMMTLDIADAILSHVSNFAVGLIRRVEGAGSTVLGSGVLVSIEGRRGILTAGHVAAAYEKLPEVGLIRFVAGGQQRRTLKLGDTQTIILQSSDTFTESKAVFDLAFTQLPPDAASLIEAQTKGSTLTRCLGLSRNSRNSPSLRERNS